jgi:hypothetical protein
MWMYPPHTSHNSWAWLLDTATDDVKLKDNLSDPLPVLKRLGLA